MWEGFVMLVLCRCLIYVILIGIGLFAVRSSLLFWKSHLIKLCRMHPVVYGILDYLYCDRQHNTFDVQFIFIYIIWLYYMFRP
jgi:hypothetical protein